MFYGATTLGTDAYVLNLILCASRPCSDGALVQKDKISILPLVRHSHSIVKPNGESEPNEL